MSRHRNLKNIIAESYENEHHDGYDYYDYEGGEDYGLSPEDENIVNQVWEVVGEEFEQDGIIQALDKCQWNINTAINLIFNNPAQYQQGKENSKQLLNFNQEKPKAKTQGNNKTQNNQKKQKEASDFPTIGGKVKAETTTQMKKKPKPQQKQTKQGSDKIYSLDEKNEEFKQSEDTSKYVNKAKFNQIVGDLTLPKRIMDSLHHSNNLFVVVCGHVDSGKSTLSGHLLYQYGMVDKKTIHKHEKESTQLGKDAMKYAWIMDEREDEKNRGITIEVGIRQIETKHKKITLLDAPGHRDFVANMIGGTAQADVALLVIDSVPNAFKAGFCKGGQTQEHAILARSMGIETIIVAINKLDTTNWSQSNFDTIAGQVIPFLEEIGFQKQNIKLIPISGLRGENVFKKSCVEDLAWYEGPCLIDILDNIDLTAKNIKKPLRMVLNSVYQATSGNIKGLCFSGKIESGLIEKGSKYVVMPACGEVVIKDLAVDDEKKSFAIPGERVIVSIQAEESYIPNFKYGCIVCPLEYPIPLATKFTAEIEVFEFERPLIRGEKTLMYVGLNKICASLMKIHHTIKSGTDQIIKKNPRFITKGDVASVEIVCEKTTCLELFKNNPMFGRIILREKDHTIASGMITHIIS